MTRRLPEPETRSREYLERSQSSPRDTVQRVSEAPRRVGEGVNESFGPIVPAVPASILFFARKHALTRVETRLTAMSERIMRLSAAAGRS